MRNQISNAVRELLPEGLSPRADSPQERKSSKTREVILDAALDCFAEHGFANTTHNLICQRAKVSRGAMLHHYPTTQDLLVSVIDYAFYQHMTTFSEKVGQLTEEDRMDRNSAIVIDWLLCQSCEMMVYMELRMASRTNSVLRTVFVPRARHHDLVWKEELLKIFPEWRDDMRRLELTRRLTRAILEGLTLSRELWRDTKAEWSILKFTADMVRMIRIGDLAFPEESETEVFKNSASLAAKRPRRSPVRAVAGK